jgi:hypothetical protein
VFKHIRKALPKNMREQLRQLEDLPLPNESVALSFTEMLSDFCHPMTALNWDDTQNLIDSNDALTAFFEQDARAALAAALPENLVIGEPIPLRDLHA